jgi:hypothetical protein
MRSETRDVKFEREGVKYTMQEILNLINKDNQHEFQVVLIDPQPIPNKQPAVEAFSKAFADETVVETTATIDGWIVKLEGIRKNEDGKTEELEDILVVIRKETAYVLVIDDENGEVFTATYKLG